MIYSNIWLNHLLHSKTGVQILQLKGDISGFASHLYLEHSWSVSQDTDYAEYGFS